jgi:hypothetical protein
VNIGYWCSFSSVSSCQARVVTVKKILKAVLSRCEWVKDDYSLRVENLPKALPKPEQQALDFSDSEHS